MYNLSKQLKDIGFNIDLLKNVVEKNINLKKFNTLQYFCIYIFLNDFEIKVDGKKIEIDAGQAIFIGPFRTIEFVRSIHTDIYVIVFTSQFYEKSKKDSFFLNSEIFFNDHNQVQTIRYFGTTEYIRLILSNRLKYFKDANYDVYLMVAHNIIEGLLLDALTCIHPASEKREESVNILSIGNSFKTMLQKDIRKNRTVSHYASQLCITEKKLTKVVRHLYGQTAKQMIIQKLCNECVIAITHSNMTVSEVSFEFGFSCESNLTHFMRKHTGKTPTELRFFAERNTD